MAKTVIAHTNNIFFIGLIFLDKVYFALNVRIKKGTEPTGILAVFFYFSEKLKSLRIKIRHCKVTNFVLVFKKISPCLTLFNIMVRTADIPVRIFLVNVIAE
jgi:hypothetical protein